MSRTQTTGGRLHITLFRTHAYTGGVSLAFAFAYSSAGVNQVGNIIPFLPSNLASSLGLPHHHHDHHDGSASGASASAGAAATSTTGGKCCQVPKRMLLMTRPATHAEQ
jgi:hypothetical protein